MPVGQKGVIVEQICENCKHWDRICGNQDDGGWCMCKFVWYKLNYAPTVPSNLLEARPVRADFGCIHFQEKPAGPFFVAAHTTSLEKWGIVYEKRSVIDSCSMQLHLGLSEIAAENLARWLNELWPKESNG